MEDRPVITPLIIRQSVQPLKVATEKAMRSQLLEKKGVNPDLSQELNPKEVLSKYRLFEGDYSDLTVTELDYLAKIVKTSGLPLDFIGSPTENVVRYINEQISLLSLGHNVVTTHMPMSERKLDEKIEFLEMWLDELKRLRGY